MTLKRRDCWSNALGPSKQQDAEMLALDRLEDALPPPDSATLYIRSLIAMLECCHFKALARIRHIIAAIGEGNTLKGPGKRPSDDLSDAERQWQKIVSLLTEWLNGEGSSLSAAGGLNAKRIDELVGERTAAKAWIVARLRERIAQYLDPAEKYYNLSSDFGQYCNSGYGLDRRPYADEQHFVALCNDIILREPHFVTAHPISLATALDSLEPCNWNFIGNITILLRCIGGDTHTQIPFATCTRNITHHPQIDEFRQICSEIRAYCNNAIIEDCSGKISDKTTDTQHRNAECAHTRDFEGVVSRDSEGIMARDTKGAVMQDIEGAKARGSEGAVMQDIEGAKAVNYTNEFSAAKTVKTAAAPTGEIARQLGEQSMVKVWLAASLEKTVREQTGG